jgi:hypothetical protein
MSLGNGNIEAFAGLVSGSDLVPIFTGAGTMGTIQRSDLINGVSYDVQVDDLAGRVAYDGQEEGYAVLVADVGDGRSALYTKRSNTSADWSAPAYITGATGETGPYTDLIFAPVQTLAPGEDVTQTTDTSVPGQLTITLGIPVGVPGDMAGPNGGVMDGDYVVFDGSSGKLVKKANGPPVGQNDALFALEISDLKGLRLGMVGGVADAFDDETGVDVKTNAVYDATNDRYTPQLATGTVAASTTLNADGSVASQRKYRSRIAAAGISASGSYIRIRLDGPAAGPAKTYTNVFFGRAAPSGDAWDMASSGPAPVRITFGGANSVTPPVGGSILSDWIAFSLDNTFAHIVAVDGSTSTGAVRYVDGAPANYTTWFKDGAADEAGTPDVTGYASFSGVFSFSGLVVSSTHPVMSMTLVSVAYPSAVQPANGRMSFQVTGSETITPNVDLIAEMTRDGGTTWTAGTLSLTMTFSGVRMFEASTIDLSAQPVGSNVKWRLRTANGKNIQASGVVAQWKD